jgi:amino acid transporter
MTTDFRQLVDLNEPLPGNSVLDVQSSVILLTIVTLLVLVMLITTAVCVFKRRDLQPLKIRSSKLLFVAVLANTAIVFQIYVI